MSKKGLNGLDEEESFDLLWVLPMENIQYEELIDHGMNQLVDGDAPMQMLNLVIQEQQQKLLEGQYTKDDDYVDQIQYVQEEEDQKIKRNSNKPFEYVFHLFFVQVQKEKEQEEGKKRWIEIKVKIKLNVNLVQEQTEALWLLLKEFQDIFAWHKGELCNYNIGEHTINTQGLPPC